MQTESSKHLSYSPFVLYAERERHLNWIVEVTALRSDRLVFCHTSFCIGNGLVGLPLDSEQPPQAPLMESVNFSCILLGDCPTFETIQGDR